MGIYNTFDYGDGTLYGDASKVGFSADPFTATAVGNAVLPTQRIVSRASDGTPTYGTVEVSFPTVFLSWTNPTGAIFGFRIVRNQDGWSEHEEDGVIVLETFSPVIPAATTVIDQMSSTPLQEGMYAYYTVWLLTADYSWVVGAHTYCLIPKTHDSLNPDGTIYKNSTRKFIELFPKVYTSQAQSYLDEVNEDSDFYTFFSGLAYTLDEIQTYTDLLVPDISGKSTNPNMVSLQAQQMGLPTDNVLSIQRKKDLIRNNIVINKYRCTVGGARQFTQSVTGFPTQLFMSPNLLLSSQDSSFYKTVGNWVAGTNGTLTSNLTTGSTDLPSQAENFSIDRSYTGKFVTTSTNVYMSLGADNPRLKGIPVNAGKLYQLSYYVKDSGINVTPSVTWYDMSGAVLSTSTGTAAAAGSTWSEVAFKVTAPSNAWFASLKLTFATAGTFYVDMVQFANTDDYRYNVFYEARAAELFLAPSKTNYVPNPSLGSTTSWTLSGFTSTTNPTSTLAGIKLDGSNMLATTATSSASCSLSTTTLGRIEPGQYYTFSIYAATATNTETLAFTLAAYGSDNNLLTLSNGASATKTLSAQTISTTWKRYSVSVFVPDTQDAVYLKATVAGTGAGNQVYFDAAQIEAGYVATDYFDGNYSSRGAYWLGSANNSVSVMYRNKSPKIDAVVRYAPEEFPLNTPYLITSGDRDVAGISVQAPTIATGTVTLVTDQVHGFSVGQQVLISGLTPSGYNGTYTITAVPSLTSFSYTNATTGALTVNGTVMSIPNLETSGYSA